MRVVWVDRDTRSAIAATGIEIPNFGCSSSERSHALAESAAAQAERQNEFWHPSSRSGSSLALA